MLELKNICFERNGKKILDNINLTIDNDNFIAITGPNGSGKSTLAKIIMGIEKQDSGQIFLDGEDISDKSITERANLGIAFAFQSPVKFKGITVFDILKLASGGELKREEACEVLSKVGLCAKDYLDRELNNSLSGGELKRIEISTVILRKSKLTIFDEPEAGIDLWSFNNLIQVFKDIRNLVKGTNIVITHQERILKIADIIILLRDGQIESIGKNDEILKSIINDCPIGGNENECNR